MTELIWDGKYIDGKRQRPVRVALPFQTTETVNESAVDRQRTLELFSTGRDTEWRNRLIWGDKKYVLPSLLPEFAGKVNLIYIDPPFDTGSDFSFITEIPESPDSFTKQPSLLEQKAYRDTWGRGLDSYLHWFYDTAVLLLELLSETGSIYVHLDWHVGHYAKAILDEVFGVQHFQNEIIWKATNAHNDAKRYGSIHQNIYFYTKSDSWTWNVQYDNYSAEYEEKYYRYKDSEGRRYASGDVAAAGPGPAKYFGDKLLKPPAGSHWRFSQENINELLKNGRIFFTENGFPRYKRYLDEMRGIPAQTLWLEENVPYIVSWSTEGVGYDTQKSEAVLERIIKASSNEGDLILDCFIGSGTAVAVAEKLNRRWIASDLGRFAIHTSRKRLLSVPGVKPFAVQNLGKYERQAWQTMEFQTGGEGAIEQQRQRETAYRKFILDLYRANPVSGHSWLHGIKSGRMVHVGAVDAPVTLTDVKSIAREAWKSATGSGASRKAAADILGWEFAFELNETARQVAAESRVDVNFKKIPREVLEKKAVEQGDIKFFELGALSVEPKQMGRELSLTLTDFVIPIDDVPEEARKAIKHWSQMIDYWAIDWDFRDDTFHNEWQSYRTRREPKIELVTKHEYKNPGSYKVMVKVIDILGNDTTKTLDIKVK